MSGIAGFYGKPDTRLLHAMTDIIAHRGPDDQGYSELPEMSLGHRRLSVIDVDHGHQPLATDDGRLQIALDGAIYNYRELRSQLRELGYAFNTGTDAEVVLHAYEEYGLKCFARFNGMFAVAIADTAKHQLILARDQFGIKPLYYAETAERTLFASEIKSLLQDPMLERAPNDRVISQYLASGLHGHTAETFFAGICALPAAHYAIVDGNGLELQRYWEAQLTATADPSPDEFRVQLRKAVERRLSAEVPVGACLSDSLDSAGLVSLMGEITRRQSSEAGVAAGAIKTYSAVLGMESGERDRINAEVELAGVDNAVTQPASDKFVTELENLLWHQEEPLVSSAPYTQWDAMRRAGQDVRVVLDSVGGEELFAGQVPYQLVYLRQLLKQHRYVSFCREYWAARDIVRPFMRYQRSLKASRPSATAMLRPEFTADLAKSGDNRPYDNLRQHLLEELTTYRLPALLRYADRNAAAFAVEARQPYLDLELVEWVLGLPDEALIHGGWSSAVVRNALTGLVPDSTRERRTAISATPPESRWMKARRAIFQSIINSPSFQNRKYWNGQTIAEEFRAMLEGRRPWTLFFWRAINVELWLRVFFEGADRLPGHALGYTYVGDARAAEIAATPAAAELLATAQPNPGKSLFLTIRAAIFGRVPVRSKLVEAGDDIVAVVRDALAGRAKSGDIIAISEKIVAISQGRSFPVASIKPTKMARFLAHFVRKTPSGIGLGIPETMELAIREVGLTRILIACAVTAVTRVFGLRGLFYRIVGPQAAAIDGPTPGTIPPYNTHAKLAPKDPDQVAEKIARALGDGIGVAIIDANDLGVNILGHTRGVDPNLVSKLFIDNPLGQGHQQTPIALLREVSA